MSVKSSVGDQVYSGLAEFGKIKAGFNLFSTVIFSLIIFVIGVVLTRMHKQYNSETNSKIIKSACSSKPGNSSSQYECNLSVDFTVDSTVYTIDNLTITSGTKYIPGNTIKIFYNKSDPNEATISKFNNLWGWALIIVSFFIFMYSIINFWLTTKYKGYAAFEGASNVAGAFGGRGGLISPQNYSGITGSSLGM